MSLTFKGVGIGGYAGYELTDQLLHNIKGWLDWGMLHHGAYNFYLKDQDSFFADNESRLHPAVDGRYPQNCVWEGVGAAGWVWESGVTPMSGGIAPFRVSGIYIDNTFISINDTSGPSRFHVDYLHGRILFEESQDPLSDIRAEYTSRSVFVGMADSRNFQNLMLESVEEFLSNTVPSGTASRDEQIWLPSIFIEVQSGSGRGLMLGGGQIKLRTIVLHIFADSAGERNLLLDWLDFQNRTAFVLGDINSMPQMFDEFGSIMPGITNPIDLQSQFPYRKLRIQDGTCKTINSLNTKLFRGQVRWNVEIDIGSI